MADASQDPLSKDPGNRLDDESSDEELLHDRDILVLRTTMAQKYKSELSEMRTITWAWSEQIDKFLLPYIGFSLFLAPEKHFQISRFAGLATAFFIAIVLIFMAGGGKLGCAVCTTAYPFYQSWKLLRDLGDAARRGQHTDEFVQWGTYWVIVGAFTVAEQVVGALFFSSKLHWLYWYVTICDAARAGAVPEAIRVTPCCRYAKLLVLVYCFFPRTQGATVLFWTLFPSRMTEFAEVTIQLSRLPSCAVIACFAMQYGPSVVSCILCRTRMRSELMPQNHHCIVKQLFT